MLMLSNLIQEGQQATTLPELCRVLSEVTAYVMQTGRRGGRFYYDEKGQRHYRELTPREKARAAGGAAGETPRPSAAEYDQLWRNSLHGGRAGQKLRGIFGDKAPTPQDMETMFSSQGINAKLDSLSVSDYDGSVAASYTVRDQDGTLIGSMNRRFSLKNGKKHVYHAYLRLSDSAQGGGRTGAMFGQALKTYQKMGVQQVGVSASLTTGPYAWARFGFQPSNYEMQSLRSEFTNFLQMPPIKMSAAAARAVVEENGKDLYNLSGTTVQVTQLNPETGEEEQKTISAGKDFLLYSQSGSPRDWQGTADLEDPKTVERWQAQAKKGEDQRKKAIATGKQNERTTASNEQRKKWDETRDSYTSYGRRAWQAGQDRAQMMRRQRGAAPAPARAPVVSPAAAAPASGSVFTQRASQFGTNPEQEREVERRAARRISSEQGRRRDDPAYARRAALSMDDYADRERGFERAAILRAARQAAAPAPAPARSTGGADQAAAARRAKGPTPVPAPVTPAVSPQAADLIRKGQAQTRAAQAALAAPAASAVPAKKPEPSTPEKRAAKYGTTVAQERRIDAIAQRKKQAELLKRRELRQQAQAVGRQPPEFIPIRKYEQRIRALERARLRR
jgi:hypothetical protein